MVEPGFQGVNRLFVLVFKNGTQRTSHYGYYVPNVEIENYNVMINGENSFDQPVKEVNFITTPLKNGYKTTILLCIQHIMKENMLLLKDLLGH